MIYLNNAATSFPKPQEVINAVMQYVNTTPYHYSKYNKQINPVYECRETLAELFNVKNPNNIVLTSGATESLNTIINGLNLDGGHAITTAIEHNSILRPLMRLEKENGLEISIIDPDGNGKINPKDIENAIKNNTRAIIVNHCSNVTGEITDIKAISYIAKAHNLIFVVDAAQSAGSIKIDVEDLKVDMLAFTGHKALYGLPGTGGFYITDEIRINPLKVGGTGVRSEELFQPESLPMLYESGTQNTPGIVSLNAGTKFVLKTGYKELKNKTNILFNNIVSEFNSMPEIKIYGDTSLENRTSSLISFNINGMASEEVADILEVHYNVKVRYGLQCAPLVNKILCTTHEGIVRASFSYFTEESEIQTFINAVKDICVKNK